MDYLIVCSSPRTGSTWLCSLLEQAGLISGGFEFFEPGHVMPRRIFPALGTSIEQVIADFDGYVEAIKAKWSQPGRYFCVKLHWRDFQKFPKKLDLSRHFPGARYLVCSREDLVLQSISNYRARATGGWVRGLSQRAEPAYDFHAINLEIEELRRYAEAWERYFIEKDVQPFRLTYETLERNPPRTIRAVAGWLGHPIGWWKSVRLKSPIQKQRDETAERWRTRFIMERLSK